MAKAQQKSPLAQYSQPMRTPALIGGWNARDPLPDMPAGDAVILQNMIPGLTGVNLRTGYSPTATGVGSPIKTLMPFSGPASSKLFAAAGGSIFDVTNSGPVGAAAVTGLTGNNFSSCMFATPAPLNWLVAVNGVDPIQEFNGTSWSVPTLTYASGSPANPFLSVAAIANRLWFIEANTLHTWYLGVGAIQGAAALFDLGQQASLGGSLVAMATWSQQGGTTPLDYACFLTSMGEVIIYQGTDPSSATTWSLAGRFRIPQPVGTNCALKSGADVILMTVMGVIPLSSILPMSISAQGKFAVTDKIKGAFQSAVATSQALPGWQVVEYQKASIIIVNVPQSDGVTFQQYVMSTVTGSWCNFVNINALCWSLFGSSIFFGDASGNVYQFDVGTSDNGNAIPFVALPAFSAFSPPSYYVPPSGFKRFLMARPFIVAQPGTAPPVSIRVDYDISAPILTQSTLPANSSPWGTSPWDTSSWGAAPTSIAVWQGLAGIGQVGAVLVAGYSLTSLTLNHIDVLVEEGGIF